MAVEPDENPGSRRFTAYAAAWELDLVGDIIKPGSFGAFLQEWRAGRRLVTLNDSHSYKSILDVYGKLVAAREDSHGLLTTWEVIGGPDGDRVLERVRSGAVKYCSIGYVPLAWDNPDHSQKTAGARRVLTKIDLREVSLVQSPANRRAVVTDTAGKILPPAVMPEAERRAIAERGFLLKKRHRERVVADSQARRERLEHLRSKVRRAQSVA